MTQVIEAANAAYAIIDQHIAAAEGNRIVLRFGDKRYSYNDLAAIANRTGNMLKRQGVTSGRSVLLAAPASPAYAGTILGAMKIGAWAVVLEGSVQQQKVAAAARAAAPVLAIVHRECLAAAESAGIACGIVAIGDTASKYKSFVDLVRDQASSLAPAKVDETANAVALLDGGQLQLVSHRDLIRGIAATDDSGHSTAFTLLRALARGDEFVLG